MNFKMIITRTPLRISFLGGGTDFANFYNKYSGCVLTTAINKYVYCIVKERFDKHIYINYSEKEIVNKVSEIKHELVREALKKVGIKEGIEIAFMSDIPSSGSGLGSSSSVTVGVLNALYQYKGLSVDAQRLAREACEIEIKILKKPSQAVSRTIFNLWRRSNSCQSFVERFAMCASPKKGKVSFMSKLFHPSNTGSRIVMVPDGLTTRRISSSVLSAFWK